MKKNTLTLQELATFMRNLAYADNQKHGIDWSLYVIHPSTNDGCVGFSGGLWHRNRIKDWVSVSFSFDEIRGIYNFKLWIDSCEIRFAFEETPTFEEFKETCIKRFKVDKLYEPK